MTRSQNQDLWANPKKRRGENKILKEKVSFSLHAKATDATAALSVGSLALHLLANLDVDFEELGDAAVQADGFALVQLGFPVV